MKKRHQRFYASTSWTRSFRMVSRANQKPRMISVLEQTPPGIPGQTYKDIGIASVAMGGGDILPALEAGTIDLLNGVVLSLTWFLVSKSS